ncbi:hypothetical protein [Trichormus sp. NMC-1]|nr:hypothetical protein [Trichormus sp. NMC-1]
MDRRSYVEGDSYSRIQESGVGAYCNTPVQESGVKLACCLGFNFDCVPH